MTANAVDRLNQLAICAFESRKGLPIKSNDNRENMMAMIMMSTIIVWDDDGWCERECHI